MPNLVDERALAWKRLKAIQKKFSDHWPQQSAVIKSDVALAVFNATPRGRIEFVRAVVDRVGEVSKKLGPLTDRSIQRFLQLSYCDGYPSAAIQVVERLLRSKLAFTDDDFVFLIRRTADVKVVSIYTLPYVSRLVALVEAWTRDFGVSQALAKQVLRLAPTLKHYAIAEHRRLIDRLANLRNDGSVSITPGEPWGDQALADIRASRRVRSAWADLISHAADATPSMPSKRWEEKAHSLLKSVGKDGFREAMVRWLPLVDKPRPKPIDPPGYGSELGVWWISDMNAVILKGLAWICGVSQDARLARPLTQLAISAYRKLPSIGPRLAKVGNACVWALGALPGVDGVAQLAILKSRVKFGTAQKMIEKALNAAALRAGVSRDDIEELAIPTYGFSEIGRRVERFDEYSAELIVDGADTRIQWRKSDGKALKSAPASVKQARPDEIKELIQTAKDAQRMLSSRRERLDAMSLLRKSWPLSVWRERYLDHPLVGALARRLIWRFIAGDKTIDACFLAGRLVDVEGCALKLPPKSTRVELWHPIEQPIAAIQAWRAWLERHEVRQPFKQAHREVYLLTDAERRTHIYSNRFAAHILRQHQFNALCAARGWRNTLRLPVDAEYPPPTRSLPDWNLRAEFWIDAVVDDPVDYHTAAYPFVATDQVRFYPIDSAEHKAHAGGGVYAVGNRGLAAEPIPLDQIPPLVFSEVMRDVDLFVGVASVGNDPTWNDGGPQGRYRDYWNEYAFGSLSTSANTRKTVLMGLIPRLAIAPRCSFEGNFLVVRGDIRSYKIHLGSANILMTPNDQYLCIVPTRGPAKKSPDRLFLPFEGDERLSVILSKALMLADDTKIADPTIRSQIR